MTLDLTGHGMLGLTRDALTTLRNALAMRGNFSEVSWEYFGNLTMEGVQRFV